MVHMSDEHNHGHRHGYELRRMRRVGARGDRRHPWREHRRVDLGSGTVIIDSERPVETGAIKNAVKEAGYELAS